MLDEEEKYPQCKSSCFQISTKCCGVIDIELKVTYDRDTSHCQIHCLKEAMICALSAKKCTPECAGTKLWPPSRVFFEWKFCLMMP